MRLIEMKTKAKRFYLTIFCVRFYCVIFVLLCDICFVSAIFDHHIRIKTKQIRKKGISRLPGLRVTLNFSLGAAKSQWGDANYRSGDPSLLQFKYWLYFHSQEMALFHYNDTATV